MVKILIRKIASIALIVLIGTIYCPSLAQAGSPSIPNSLVKLYITYQDYEASSPWKKKKNRSRSGYGCVLPSHKILTTADLIRNRTMIEVEKNTEKKYYLASVEVWDYDVDLAVLTVEDKGFFNDLTGVEMDDTVKIDQPVKFLVFEKSKEIRTIPGKIVKIAVDEYYLGWNNYLIYGSAVNFEGRGGGWSEPVFSRGKLIGLTMSYSAKNQYAEIIPASIIQRFLRAIKEDGYVGFPYHGFLGTVVRSPALKAYLGLPPGRQGLYIRAVFPGSTAAGVLKTGDMLLSVDGYQLDSDGYYQHPEWGKLVYSDRFSRYHCPGEVIKVEILRDGKIIPKEMVLKRFDQSDYLIPIYSYDAPPQYIIIGGLIIQELNLDYLKAWGEKWKDEGNKKYLYYYNYEARNPRPERKRLVILNKVLPDDINVGYQELGDLVISEVNGHPISRIQDVTEALRFPEGGFHKFTFEEYNRELVLPADKLEQADLRITKQYGISKTVNVD